MQLFSIKERQLVLKKYIKCRLTLDFLDRFLSNWLVLPVTTKLPCVMQVLLTLSLIHCQRDEGTRIICSCFSLGCFPTGMKYNMLL